MMSASTRRPPFAISALLLLVTPLLVAAAPRSIRTVTGDSVEEAMPRRPWQVPVSAPRDLPGKGSTEDAGPPSWAGPSYLRSIWGVASGRRYADEGLRGWLLRVPTGRSLLVTGFETPPPAGMALVVQGPWSPHPLFGWGVVWNARVRRWRALPLADLAPFSPDGNHLEEHGGWRKLLSSDKGFRGLFAAPVGGPEGAEPELELQVEAWRYAGRASSALARLARNRLAQHLRRERLRRRAATLDLGPRAPALALHRVGHLAGWQTALVASEELGGGAWLWAVGGGWIVVIRGDGVVTVDVAGRALLAQEAWSPSRP